MSPENFLPGVLAPVLTPFKQNLAPDTDLFVRFCRWLHGKGVGLAIFGTNSEANSMSVAERSDLLAAVIAGGLPARALLPGTGTCAIPDSVRLSAEAARAGCAGVLMLPPFYYKPVSEDGLFAAYSEVVERVGDARLKILLYHIPQLSGVPIPAGLI
jgi:4-hydroxy-tetrahydrodipicolinate synthase